MIGWHWCFRLLLLSWVRQALANDSQFAEKLTFYPLENGLLLAHFQFTQSMAYVPGRMRRVTNYGSFPPVIGEIVEDFGVAEARISFGRGRWDHYVWGHPPSDSFELASTGIQLHAWIEGSDAEVDRQWEKLTGALSGIFCGSISLVNEAKTAQPQLALLPTCPSITNETHGLRFGVLPRETVCTENLTPWLKLLPCMSNGGLASLINPRKVYGSRFNLMDLGLRTFPTGPNEGRIEIVQNLAIVIDIFRWTHSADWNLTSIFERTVEKLCPACTVEPELTLFYQKKIGRVAQWEEGQEVKGRSKIVGLRYVGDAIVQRDIGVQYKEKTLPDGFIPSPNTLITRYFTGSGQESGSLFVRIDNIDNVPAPVTILEVLPWYMRLYMHTLRVTLNGKPIDVGNQDIFKRVLYSPSVDRVKPTAIEYDLVIPAAAVLTFDLQFDMVLLRYTEYPLDPNRGVDVNGAFVRYLDASGKSRYLCTGTLLLTLPTPDFTMPFNVIMLTSMSLTVFYGQFYNLLFRLFYLADPKQPHTPLGRLKRFFLTRILRRKA